MQFLHFVLVAAFVAAAVANTTIDIASLLKVTARFVAANKACSQQFKNDERCFLDCTYKHTGILDSDGRYVPSAFADILLDFSYFTQQEAIELTRTCGSGKGEPTADCERAHVVYDCFQKGLEKVEAARKSTVQGRIAAAAFACEEFKNDGLCYDDCGLEHFGVWDSEGQYVQSAAAEVLSFQFPKLTQQQVTEAITTCSSALNKLTAAGCERTKIVSGCLDNALEKLGFQVKSAIPNTASHPAASWILQPLVIAAMYGIWVV